MGSKSKQRSMHINCPCGGKSFETCCEAFLKGECKPETAEQLMRSRYSAFTLGDEPYLLATWHPAHRPKHLALEAEQTKWLGLEVLAHRPIDSRHAEVEFVARFKTGNGPATRLHERSRFERVGEQWLYVDGEIF